MCLLVAELTGLKLPSAIGFPHVLEDSSITVIAQAVTFFVLFKKQEKVIVWCGLAWYIKIDI